MSLDARPVTAGLDCVVFDLGGVVFSWPTSFDPLMSRMGTAAGVTNDEFGRAYFAARAAFDEDSDAAVYWAAVAAASGAPVPDAATVAALTELDLGRWSNLVPGTVSLIGELGELGVRTAVLSNAPASMGMHVRGQAWSASMSPIVISGEIGLVKPHPEIFHYLLDQLGSEPNRVAFLDDLAENVAGARSVGIHGVQFTDAVAARAALRELGLPLP